MSLAAPKKKILHLIGALCVCVCVCVYMSCGLAAFGSPYLWPHRGKMWGAFFFLFFFSLLFFLFFLICSHHQRWSQPSEVGSWFQKIDLLWSFHPIQPVMVRSVGSVCVRGPWGILATDNTYMYVCMYVCMYCMFHGRWGWLERPVFVFVFQWPYN